LHLRLNAWDEDVSREDARTRFGVAPPDAVAGRWLGGFLAGPESRFLPLTVVAARDAAVGYVRRPLTFKIRNEVFMGGKHAREADAVLYRARDERFPDDVRLHFHQLLTIPSDYFNCDVEAFASYVLESQKTAAMTREDLREFVRKTKPGRATIANSAVLKFAHFGDALVRMAICQLLNDRGGPDTCHSTSATAREIPNTNRSLVPPGCRNMVHPMEVFNCYLPYKITLAMENSQFDGYVSEKILTAARGHAVPAYFGAPDYGDFVNPAGVLNCTLKSKTTVERLREDAQYPSRFKGMRLPEGWNPKERPPPQKIIRWAVEYLEKDISDCVDAILNLLGDEEAYLDYLEKDLVGLDATEKRALDGVGMTVSFLALVRVLDAWPGVVNGEFAPAAKFQRDWRSVEDVARRVAPAASAARAGAAAV